MSHASPEYFTEPEDFTPIGTIVGLGLGVLIGALSPFHALGLLGRGVYWGTSVAKAATIAGAATGVLVDVGRHDEATQNRRQIEDRAFEVCRADAAAQGVTLDRASRCHTPAGEHRSWIALARMITEGRSLTWQVG